MSESDSDESGSALPSSDSDDAGPSAAGATAAAGEDSDGEEGGYGAGGLSWQAVMAQVMGGAPDDDADDAPSSDDAPDAEDGVGGSAAVPRPRHQRQHDDERGERPVKGGKKKGGTLKKSKQAGRGAKQLATGGRKLSGRKAQTLAKQKDRRKGKVGLA